MFYAAKIHRNKCKPWMTNGLVNSCKKKNRLYKMFLKIPNLQNETLYKDYKNKLTSIMRKAEKKYCIKLLQYNIGIQNKHRKS